jgi:hypothetical protein
MSERLCVRCREPLRGLTRTLPSLVVVDGVEQPVRVVCLRCYVAAHDTGMDEEPQNAREREVARMAYVRGCIETTIAAPTAFDFAAHARHAVRAYPDPPRDER